MVDYGFSISPGEEAFIGVSPEGIISGEEIKNIDMDKRGCYATGERELAFYHHYSLLNCYMECVSNYTDLVLNLNYILGVCNRGGTRFSNNRKSGF